MYQPPTSIPIGSSIPSRSHPLQPLISISQNASHLDIVLYLHKTMEMGSSSKDSISAGYLKGWRVIRLGGRKTDQCCTELVESCYRYGNILPTLSVRHSTCVITWADVEPLRNWQAIQLKPKSEGSDRGGE